MDASQSSEQPEGHEQALAGVEEGAEPTFDEVFRLVSEKARGPSPPVPCGARVLYELAVSGWGYVVRVEGWERRERGGALKPLSQALASPRRSLCT